MKEPKSQTNDRVYVNPMDVKISVKSISAYSLFCDVASISVKDGYTVSLPSLNESIFQVQSFKRSTFIQSSKAMVVPGSITRVINFTRSPVTTVDITGLRFVSYPVDNKFIGASYRDFSKTGFGFPTQEIGDLCDFFSKIGYDISNKVTIARLMRVTGKTKQDIFDTTDRFSMRVSNKEKASNPTIYEGLDLEGNPIFFADIVIFSFIDGGELARNSTVFEEVTCLQFSTDSIRDSSAHLLDPRHDIHDLSWVDEDYPKGEVVMLSYFYLVGKDGVEPTHPFFRDGTGEVIRIPVRYASVTGSHKASGLYARWTTKRLNNARALVKDRFVDPSKINEKLGFFKTEDEARSMTTVEVIDKLNNAAMQLDKAKVDLLVSLGKTITEAFTKMVKDVIEKIDQTKEHVREVNTMKTKFDDLSRQAKYASEKLLRDKDEEIAKEKRKNEDLSRRIEDEKRKLDDFKRSRAHLFEAFKNVTLVVTSILALVVAVKPLIKDKNTKKATSM